MKRKPNILVVGSFVMDQIVATSIFPNEGETVLGETFHKAPGGKGANQAVQAARLGANVTMIGKLGKDANAEEMLATCKAAGIHTEYVMFDEETHTGCSVIILEQSPGKSTVNRIIVVSGANMTIQPEEIAFLKERIKDFDMVILQLEIPMEINELVCKYAYDAGVPVMLNPAPSDELSPEMISHLTYISPNEHEAASMTKVHITNQGGNLSLEEAQQAAKVLHDQGAKNVIITLGESGAVLFEKEALVHSPSVKGVVAVDPTAAGDSFVAAFCCGVCVGMEHKDALSFANHTAALTVSRLGAMPSLPTLQEVSAFMAEHGVAVPFLDSLA